MRIHACFILAFLLGTSLSEVRKLYPKSADDQKNAEAFLAKLESVDDDANTTLVGYKGAAIAMQAKFAKTIKEKKQLLNTGAVLIEKSIATDPGNIELRMVRLSIQESLPKIVGYSKNMKEDRDFIISKLPSAPSDIKSYISDFVLQSKSFSTAEKAAIKR